MYWYNFAIINYYYISLQLPSIIMLGHWQLLGVITLLELPIFTTFVQIPIVIILVLQLLTNITFLKKWLLNSKLC
jgi:hypothetical protein